MTHPLQQIIDVAEPFVLIGDSSDGHFPAMSYHAYTALGRRFYCVDLGGLGESRGKTAGGPVFASAADLPDDRSDLAVLWTHPHKAKGAVDVAHEAGCKRVWFSFQTGHRDAVAHARELGMEVVEIGRCPVYYLPTKGMPMECRWHVRLTKLTGAHRRPPQTDPDAKRREIW